MDTLKDLLDRVKSNAIVVIHNGNEYRYEKNKVPDTKFYDFLNHRVLEIENRQDALYITISDNSYVGDNRMAIAEKIYIEFNVKIPILTWSAMTEKQMQAIYNELKGAN